ncbi:MAG: hypothetical protein PHP83_02375 [Clostridia bacterium]|nr:hypothetical protein [Clostridia bacterium]
MTKQRSKLFFILTSIFLAIGLVLSFVSFNFPLSINGVHYSYVSFAQKLKTSASVFGGSYLEYTASMPDDADDAYYDVYKSDTIANMKSIMTLGGYYDSSVFWVGDNILRIEASDIKNTQDESELLSMIGNTYLLEFKTNTSDTDSFTNGRHITNAKVLSNTNGYYGVEASFDDEGTQALSEATSGETKTFYMIFGTQTVSYESPSQITDGILTLYSESFTTETEAKNFATMIKIGMSPLDLELSTSGPISAELGVGTKLILYIGIVLAFALLITFLILFTKHFGLLTLFNLSIFVVIFMFILQSIPFVFVNFGGIIGMMFMFVIALSSYFTIYSNIKYHYESGKLLHTSYRLGQKQSFNLILTTNIILFVVGSVMSLLPNLALRSFGFMLFVGCPINLICTLLIFKGVMKMYSVLNFDNSKALNIQPVKAEVSANEN